MNDSVMLQRSENLDGEKTGRYPELATIVVLDLVGM
jgi:hypothetical protein